MKNLLRAFIAIAGFLLFTAPIANAVADKAHVPIALVDVILIAAAVVLVKLSSKKRNGQIAGVEVEMWVNYIIERLFKDNAFLNTAYSDDEYVLAGKVVHIPQPGSKPTVVKGRTTFPATAVRRTDTDITYSLDEYTTDPTHIENAEMIEPSYSKIDSVFGDHAGVLTENVADDMIIKWLTGIGAGSKALTTGAATAGTAAGATGNRKLLTVADFRAQMTKMNADNIMKNDRYALLSSNLLDQLIGQLSESQYRSFTDNVDLKNGVVGKLFGFQIIDRSIVAISDNTNTVKALGEANAVTDNEVAVFYQKNAIARALGTKQFFEDVNNPLYYGDVYSALLRAGGRRRRADDKGIIMLNQAPSV